MGGFEWGTRVPEKMLEGVEKVKAEFAELAKNPETDGYLRYIAEELAEMWVVKPEAREKTCWYEVKETLYGEIQIPKQTYGDYFSDDFPNEGEVLLYCWETPWLWKFTPETKEIIAKVFEKHGVIEVWWAIVGDNTKSNDAMDNFWNRHGSEIFGESISITKAKPSREYL